jgi:hypothetical protein
MSAKPTTTIIRLPNKVIEEAMLKTIIKYKEELKTKVDVMIIEEFGDDRTTKHLEEIAKTFKRGYEYLEEQILKKRRLEKKEEKEVEESSEESAEESSEEECDNDEEQAYSQEF